MFRARSCVRQPATSVEQNTPAIRTILAELCGVPADVYLKCGRQKTAPYGNVCGVQQQYIIHLYPVYAS